MLSVSKGRTPEGTGALEAGSGYRLTLWLLLRRVRVRILLSLQDSVSDLFEREYSVVWADCPVAQLEGVMFSDMLAVREQIQHLTRKICPLWMHHSLPRRYSRA